MGPTFGLLVSFLAPYVPTFVFLFKTFLFFLFLSFASTFNFSVLWCLIGLGKLLMLCNKNQDSKLTNVHVSLSVALGWKWEVGGR